MGKLLQLSGDELCAILARHGFVAVRQRGSHVVMQRVTEDETTTVPVPLHRQVKKGTLALHHSAIRVAASGIHV